VKLIREVWGLLLTGLVVWTSFFVLPGHAHVQQNQERQERQIVEPSEAQMSLNDDGVRAMIEGDFAGAVSLLERAKRLGSLNVTYLNLGRAYQKLGRCPEARLALEQAKTAPAVADPPPAEVNSVADEYLAELAEVCDDNAPEAPVDTEDPDAQDPDAQDPDAQEPAAGVDRSTGPNILGWGMAATGVALVGGGVALHFIAESDRAAVLDTPEGQTVGGLTQREAAQIGEDADQLDTIGLAMGIGGGVAAAWGTYLILTDESGEEDGATVWIGPQSIGASWTQQF
jgi:tetratricopeptide (TPR) repeat protein